MNRGWLGGNGEFSVLTNHSFQRRSFVGVVILCVEVDGRGVRGGGIEVQQGPKSQWNNLRDDAMEEFECNRSTGLNRKIMLCQENIERS